MTTAPVLKHLTIAAIGFGSGAGLSLLSLKAGKPSAPVSVTASTSSPHPAGSDLKDLLSLPVPNLEQSAQIRRSLSQLLSTDPEQFVALLKGGIPDIVAIEQLPRLAAFLSGGDAESAARAIAKVPGFLQRRILAEQTLTILMKRDPATALALSDRVKSTIDSPSAKRVWQIFADVDPQAAASFASKSPGPDALPSVLNRWLSTSPEAALSWIKQNRPNEPLKPYLDNLLLSRTGDPQSLSKQVQDLGIPLNSAVEAVVKRAGPQNPEGTISWLSSMPESITREKGFALFFEKNAAQMTVARLAQALESTPSVSSQKSVVRAWSAAGAASKPERVLTESANIKNPELRDAARSEALAMWAARDYEAASQWLNDHPGETTNELRDRVELFKLH